MRIWPGEYDAGAQRRIGAHSPVHFARAAAGRPSKLRRPTRRVLGSRDASVFSAAAAWVCRYAGSPCRNRNEWVATISGGVNLIVEGLPDSGNDRRFDGPAGHLDGGNVGAPDLTGEALQDNSRSPLEIYMEGNIVFRQGDRIIYARSMYYNVMHQYGVVLDAEMLTPVPEYQGLVRLKADVLQQVDRENFIATGGALTTSRMGVPKYWFQADQIQLRDSAA